MIHCTKLRILVNFSAGPILKLFKRFTNVCHYSPLSPLTVDLSASVIIMFGSSSNVEAWVAFALLTAPCPLAPYVFPCCPTLPRLQGHPTHHSG